MRHIYLFLLLVIFWGVGIARVEATDVALSCQAKFDHEVYSGPIPSVTGITFSNLSEGNYTEVFWDFGDGNYSSSISPVIEHFYNDFGFYEVCLTIFGGDCGVESSCITLFVGDESKKCDYTDCVYPGDANSDGKADMYDVLNIGAGLSTTGPVRPDATLEWVGQPATDWGIQTGEGVDFKHLDCDGNGIIELADLEGLHTNYSLMEDEGLVYEANGAPVRLEFDADTVFLENVIPEKIMLTGRLLAGSSVNPFSTLHGLALYINYSSDFFLDEVIEVNYQPSFLGTPTDILMEHRDDRPAGQLDLAITNLEPQNTAGHGMIATVTFIIVGDIIGAREEPDVPVEFYLRGVKGVDAEGVPQTIQIPEKPVTVIFKKEDVVSTHNTDVHADVNVFPNPAITTLYVQNTTGKSGTCTLFDAFGRTVSRTRLTGFVHTLDVQELRPGFYTLIVQTDSGESRHKVVIAER